MAYKTSSNYSSKKFDNHLSIAIILPLIILSFQNLFELANSIFLHIQIEFNIFYRGIVALYFAFIFIKYFRNMLYSFVAIYFFAVMITLVQLLFFWNIYSLSIFTVIFIVNIPLLIYSSKIQNQKILYNVMSKASIIIFMINSVSSIISLLYLDDVYSMTVSYFLLLPAIVSFDKILFKKSIIQMLIFLSSVGLIIIVGSRGALLSLMLFVIFTLLFRGRTQAQKVTYTTIVVSSLLLVIIFLNDLLFAFDSLLRSFGLSSRTLYLLINDFNYNSGRSDIYQLLSYEIAHEPLLGFGIGYDRVILDGAYSHNLFYEMIINFGIIIGILLAIYLIIIIIKKIVFLKYKDVVIIWLFLGFIYLMFSGSYLIDMSFWILLGLVFNKDKTIKGDTNNEAIT